MTTVADKDSQAGQPSARDIDLRALHPLVTGKARIASPSIKTAFTIISSSIDRNHRSAAFVAFPGTGKSAAIKWLQSEVERQFPRVLVLRIIAIKQPHWMRTGTVRAADFWHGEFLRQLKHAAPTAGTSRSLFQRLVNHIVAFAAGKRARHIVIFIDEAQAWGEFFYELLKNVTNILSDEHDLVVDVFTFGQPELEELRNSLVGKPTNGLAVRFMADLYQFSRVRSLEDCEEVMAAFDNPEISCFPEDSGICYTQFFLPEAYGAGWRLQNEASLFWSSLSSEISNRDGQFGMRYVIGALRSFLCLQAENDRKGIRFTKKDWDEAVIDAGIDIPVDAA